ncbi:MAG: ANTAR domain-containing protein [Clostridia bacterium]|nr:ANTAR domain-containing protein [Clostridia bacterium]MBQ9290775.1 ANTAR domain-containing protein [Clostridia bacterium]
MARIIIASASEQVRSQLRGLLVSSGFSVFRLCESGSSLRRTINECEDGIVIFSGPLPDCKPEELQWDYGDRIQILLVGKPPVLDACESPDIFRLVLPTTGQALIGAVNMLSQLHQMQLPKRSGQEQKLVKEAKEILMRRNGLTEPQAHRIMQQHAMRSGIKMADYAAQILKASADPEE